MKTAFILGSGAIGLPLAAHLAHAGKPVLAVRTSRKDVAKGTATVTVHHSAVHFSTPVETISLAKLNKLDGTIVIAAKSYANEAIARELRDRAASGPVVIMQNGVGVEQPFLDAQFSSVYRCVLYATSQADSECEFTFRPISASPIGVIRGSASDLEKCVEALTTDGFPFRAEANIQREIWTKVIINCVFNSVCPLLEVDNGIFERDEATANLAKELIRECLTLTDRLHLGLSESELMEKLLHISKGSRQFISTLQDIRNGRPTEIEFLNLEVARIAGAMQPSLRLPRIEMLGRLILAKSSHHRRRNQASAPLLRVT